jgi:hypothetical protein
VPVEFSLIRACELKALQAACGLASRTELINAALTLLEWAVLEKQAGNVVASVNEVTLLYTTLELTLLE